MIIEAHYAKQQSEENGTTAERYKAGLRLVELAVNGDSRATIREIEQTKGTQFRPWIRISMPGFSCRAVVENTGTEILIHVILPKDSHTYDIVEELWKTYRSPLP